MTRTGHVSVEFPVEEAQGILLRLAPDGSCSMSAVQCSAAEKGRQRLEHAVKTETGPGGSCCGPESDGPYGCDDPTQTWDPAKAA